MERLVKIIVDERLFEICQEFKNPQYESIGEEVTDLFHRLLSVIPTEHKALLHQLEESLGMQESIFQDYIYRAGLRDGAGLGALFGSRVSNS